MVSCGLVEEGFEAWRYRLVGTVAIEQFLHSGGPEGDQQMHGRAGSVDIAVARFLGHANEIACRKLYDLILEKEGEGTFEHQKGFLIATMSVGSKVDRDILRQGRDNPFKNRIVPACLGTRDQNSNAIRPILERAEVCGIGGDGGESIRGHFLHLGELGVEKFTRQIAISESLQTKAI